MIVDAARELPPDGETAEGVTRRGQLTAVLLALVSGKGGAPTAEMLQAAAELFEIVELPPGARERRVLEERIWALLEHGRPIAALRALAEKVGFAARSATHQPRVEAAGPASATGQYMVLSSRSTMGFVCSSCSPSLRRAARAGVRSR